MTAGSGHDRPRRGDAPRRRLAGKRHAQGAGAGGDQRDPAGRRGAGAADHLHGDHADDRPRRQRRSADHRATTTRRTTTTRTSSSRSTPRGDVYLNADKVPTGGLEAAVAGRAAPPPRQGRLPQGRPPHQATAWPARRWRRSTAPASRTSSSAPKSRSTPSQGGAADGVLGRQGGTARAAGRDQRHPADRHRAGAAHHLHGDDAGDAEGAGGQGAAEAQTETMPQPPGENPIIVELDAQRRADPERRARSPPRRWRRGSRSGCAAIDRRWCFFKIADDANYGRAVRIMDICKGAGAQTLGIVTQSQ